MTESFSAEARLIHAGTGRAPGQPATPPLVPASIYVSDGPPQPGRGYGRESNPGWEALEEALGGLEDAQAVAFASGQAASMALMLALAPGRDRIVLAADGYYGTRVLAGNLRPHGATPVPVDLADLAVVERELAVAPSALWAETPTNPLLRVADLGGLAKAAAAAGAPMIVDNTAVTGLLQRPLDWGAAASLYSLTKAISGHSDVIAGAVVSRDEKLIADLRAWRTSGGAVPGPFEAWLALRGLKTLPLRIARQSASALAIARHLAADQRVRAVHYPGTAPSVLELARRQMPDGFGPLLSFEVGSAEAADRVVASSRLILPATSFGGVESTWERRGRWAAETAPAWPDQAVGRRGAGRRPDGGHRPCPEHAGGGVMRMAAGHYELDDDRGRIDPGAAVAFLTTQAYWARWRSAEDIKRQIAGAWRVVGVYDRAGAMVGFARAFADDANAYLGDVYVLPEHRGAGLGKAIMQLMIEDGPGASWRWMLHTADAHGLYRQFGFAAPTSRYLERPQRIDTAAPEPAASATGTLAGQSVRLEPLDHQHVPGLAAATADGAELYRWSAVPQDEGQVRRYVETAVAARDAGTAAPFAVVWTSDGTVIGSTRFFDLEYWAWPDGQARSGPDTCEIGSTWLSPKAIRTGANTEMKRLMLTHAFETWQVQSVCLHTDARNQRSRQAMERIGARFEGILRAHRLGTDGKPRDSARYSVTAADWPARPAAPGGTSRPLPLSLPPGHGAPGH